MFTILFVEWTNQSPFMRSKQLLLVLFCLILFSNCKESNSKFIISINISKFRSELIKLGSLSLEWKNALVFCIDEDFCWSELCKYYVTLMSNERSITIFLYIIIIMFCYVCMETVRCFARHEKRIFFFVQIILGLITATPPSK